MTGWTGWLLACAAALAADEAPSQIPQASSSVALTPSETVMCDPAESVSLTCDSCGCGGHSAWGPKDWKNVPPAEPLQRPGNFIPPLSGPGCYYLADAVFGCCTKEPPLSPYPRFALMPAPFFNANFAVKDNPKYRSDLFDELKRIQIGDDWMFSVGGELRYRYHNEVNARLTDFDTRHTLYRTRVFGDIWYRDLVRAYVEYIDADNWGNDLAPLPIDENRSDLLNLFGDFKVAHIAGKPVYLRGGRQELVYGSQRLLSTLDWANTRQVPFTGVKAFWHGEKLSVDAFVTQPVIFDRGNFDSIDNERLFSGLWSVYKFNDKQSAEAYFLNLDDSRGQARGDGGRLGHENISTFGLRYNGAQDSLLFDVEGMYQVGDHAGQNLSAGAATGGLGWRFADVRMTPTFWAYYDWASGTGNPLAGDNYNTFNQLFAFGHYYLGFIDLVGRRNIRDFNLHGYLYPTKFMQWGVQYHLFELDQARDALYNAAGVPIRQDITGASGRDVGSEVDFIVNISVSKRQEILFGYSHFFSGDFITGTGPNVDSEFTYLQYVFRW